MLRCRSTWVAPNHRGSRDDLPKRRRPAANGESAAFRVNEFHQETRASRSSPPPPPPPSSSLASDAAPPPPTTTAEYESDMVVVLDLDECLIHSQFSARDPAGAHRYAHQVRRDGGGWRREGGGGAVEAFEISLPGGERARVHERPHLREFLASVGARYETHLFTAAAEVYATPIVRRLDPRGTIFADLWYRDSCVLDPSLGAYVKDLEKLAPSRGGGGGDRMKRTVLIDNNPLSFLANPENGILVSSFFDDPDDRTLLAVEELLRDLECEEDVRPVLDARFGLRDSFRKLSKTGSFAGRRFQIDDKGAAAAAAAAAAEEEDQFETATATAAAGFST